MRLYVANVKPSCLFSDEKQKFQIPRRLPTFRETWHADTDQPSRFSKPQNKLNLNGKKSMISSMTDL